MPRALRFGLLLGPLFVVLMVAQPPAGPASPADGATGPAKTDSNGKEPPTRGPIARLGSTRFRTGQPITALRFTHNGKNILAGALFVDGDADAFTLLDASTGVARKRWKERGTELTPIANPVAKLGPGGKMIYKEEAEIFSWCYSDDGALLAAVQQLDDDKRIIVRDVLSGAIVFQTNETQLRFGDLHFSPDGKKLAAIRVPEKGSPDITIWNIADGKALFLLGPTEGDEDAIFSPVSFWFTAGGQRIAALGLRYGSASVRVWNLAGNGKITPMQLKGGTGGAVAFAPDGKYLADAEKNKVRLWDVDTDKIAREFNHPYDEECRVLFYSPDGNYLVIGNGAEAQLVRVADGKALVTLADCLGVTFAPNGKHLAMLGPDSVSMMELPSGKSLWSVRGIFGCGKVYQSVAAAEHGAGGPVAFSADGKVIATADEFGTIRRYDTADGKEIPLEGKNRSPAQVLTFSPNGKILATGGKAGISWWDCASRECLHQITRDEEVPGDLAMAPDGSRLAAGWSDGTISVWDLDSGKEVSAKKPYDTQVFSLTFAPNAGTIVSSDVEGQVLWTRVSGGDVIRQVDFRSDNGSPAVTLSADGRTAIAYDSKKETFSLWELATGQPRLSLGKCVQETMPCYSSDGKLALAQVTAQTLALFDLVRGEAVRHFQVDGKVAQVALSPGGKLLASLGANGTISLWDGAVGTALAPVPLGDFDRAIALAFSRDGKVLAVACKNSTLLLWDVEVLLRQPAPPRPGPAPDAPLPPGPSALPKADAKMMLPAGALHRLGSVSFQHGKHINSLRWLPDGKTLLTATTSGRTWDLPKSNQMPSLKNVTDEISTWTSATGTRLHSTKLTTLPYQSSFLRMQGATASQDDCSTIMPSWAVSPDGSLMATYDGTGDDGRRIAITDLHSGKVSKKIKLEGSAGYCVMQFTPDGKTLVVLHDQPTIHFFDVQSGAETGDVSPPKNADIWFSAFALAPDGRFLAVQQSNGASNCVHVWDLHTGQPPAVLLDPSPQSAPMTFAPDGKSLAVVVKPAGQSSSYLILHDPVTGKMVRPLGNHTELCHGLIFSPDGKYVVSLTESRVRIWTSATGKEWPSLDFDPDGVVVFAPSGQTVAIGTSESIRIYETSTWKLRHEIAGPFSFGTSPRLAPRIYNKNSDVGLFGATEGMFHHDRQGLGWPVVFSPDGQRLLVAHDTAIRQWNVATGQEIIPEGWQPPATQLAVSPDGRLLAAGSPSGVVIWDVALGKQRHWLKAKWPEQLTLAGATAKPSVLTFAGNGTMLAAGYSGGQVVLWDAEGGKQLRVVDAHKHAVTSLVFTAGGKQLRSGDSDGVRTWNVADGSMSSAFEVPVLKIAAPLPLPPMEDLGDVIPVKGAFKGGLSYSNPVPQFPEMDARPSTTVAGPDGTMTVHAGDLLRLFDTKTGELRWSTQVAYPFLGGLSKDQLRELVMYDANISLPRSLPCPLVQFSPEGHYLLFEAGDCLQLVDAGTGAKIRVFGGLNAAFPMNGEFANLPKGALWQFMALGLNGPNFLLNAVFSPNGKLLAASGSSGIYLWDTATGTLLAHRADDQGETLAVAFSPDSQRLFTAGSDATVLIWDITALTHPSTPVPSQKSLAALWQDLASTDPALAKKAMNHLRMHPAQTLTFLKQKLHPVQGPQAQMLGKWIADLDSDHFPTRAKATASLIAVGDLARPALQTALTKALSTERREAVTNLVKRLLFDPPPPQHLQLLRAVELLEIIGTPAARDLLATLTQGASLSRVTQEADAALQRLNSTAG